MIIQLARRQGFHFLVAMNRQTSREVWFNTFFGMQKRFHHVAATCTGRSPGEPCHRLHDPGSSGHTSSVPSSWPVSSTRPSGDKALAPAH